MSRTVYTAKNVLWGNVNALINLALHFVTRTIFIYTIGTVYLGVSGLFSGILGVLSMAEIGIGAAINFSLYKPVAVQDREKIKSLMLFYKKAYRYIAVLVGIVGIALLPLIPYIIKESASIENLYLYYILYLINSVTSYLVTYKYTLVNAEQKSYIISNLNLIAQVVITSVQIMMLVIYRSFLYYLVSQILLQIIQKILIGGNVDKRYPYLREKDVTPLHGDDLSNIKTNIKALIIHKLGDVSVNQTDNIIISAYIDIITVGLVSNYRLIYSSVSVFLGTVFNNITAGLGNLIAVEQKKRQKEIFDVYQFFGFWIFGFVAVCMITLIQPFIALWLGLDKQIDNLSVALIIVDQYMVGQRVTVQNFKTAAGIFKQDQMIPFVQAICNLVVSIALAMCIGLPGVFIGTVVQSVVTTIWRPIIVYRVLFGESAGTYFKNYVKYFLSVAVAAGIMWLISRVIMPQMSVLRFAILVVLTVVVPNVFFFLLYRKDASFFYLKDRMRFLVKRVMKRG